MSPLALLLALIVVHFLCDYPLQGPFLSEAKSQLKPIPGFPWWQAMTAHAAIHGGGVALVTGVWWLGLFEAVAHFIIDDLKCRNLLSVNTDQALHILCKLAWVVILLRFQ